MSKTFPEGFNLMATNYMLNNTVIWRGTKVVHWEPSYSIVHHGKCKPIPEWIRVYDLGVWAARYNIWGVSVKELIK